MHPALALASAILIAAAQLPAIGAEGPDASELRAEFASQQAVEQRVQDIGWRLVTGNARYCDGATPAIGLILHDMASYRTPAGVRGLLGLKGDFAVLAAAKASPAAQAGLTAGDEIQAIDGEYLSSWPAKPPGDWRRAARAHDWIDQRLMSDGTVTLERGDGSQVRVEGVPACPSRFELAGEGDRALAEGSRVILQRNFPGLDYPEEELAAALAHELAHNLLRHRAWLDATGRKQRNLRLTEREADRLMPWLLANAGYDPAAATRFMNRWGPRHSGGIFRKRSHDGWDERAEFIDAEVALVKQLQESDGTADWRTHFSRQSAP